MKGQMTAGILASILAALLFTAMDVSAKALGHLGMGEITFIRGLAGLLFIPLIARGEGMPLFSGKDRGLLHLRGLMGAFGILLFFYSLPGLTLGDAEILVQLSAFFMCILSPIFLKTRLPGKVIIWLFVIAAGAAIVLRIWNFQAFNGYAVLGVISSFCSACAYTCIGKLTEKGGHSGAELVFYFQVYSMAGGALLMTGHMVMPLGGDWAWILLLSFSALFAQVALTWGCTHIPPVIVTFAMYTGLLFHILAGWALWGEKLTIYSWIGGAVIVLGSVMLLWETRGKDASG
ncbi:DMT family transporter [uncultured Dialister sp.]|uniref:DMT family transporter n=1 Tax=uncultured Dialister sp. TaxID=278064 RepID=UPI0025D13505|nr:DMT family transporter [uncultured Dialister sp.]